MGKKNSPSFSANLEKGIFQCFGCRAKGNVFEFAALMENVDPTNGSEFRKVATKLQQLFCPTLALRKDKLIEKQEKEETEELPIVVTGPLDFELKQLDSTHPYLANRGFFPECLKRTVNKSTVSHV